MYNRNNTLPVSMGDENSDSFPVLNDLQDETYWEEIRTYMLLSIFPSRFIDPDFKTIRDDEEFQMWRYLAIDDTCRASARQFLCHPHASRDEVITAATLYNRIVFVWSRACDMNPEFKNYNLHLFRDYETSLDLVLLSIRLFRVSICHLELVKLCDDVKFIKDICDQESNIQLAATLLLDYEDIVKNPDIQQRVNRLREMGCKDEIPFDPLNPAIIYQERLMQLENELSQKMKESEQHAQSLLAWASRLFTPLRQSLTDTISALSYSYESRSKQDRERSTEQSPIIKV